ncbi:uncharacterized protein A4U43_C08F5450 [Asparagus officinalis]|nr:uncharacterized protein A4U43_C08F5450 [Asparagus officinalis]
MPRPPTPSSSESAQNLVLSEEARRSSSSSAVEGLPFVHTPMLATCFFYGDVNCQKDKNVYLNSILSLYDYFHEEFYQPNEINDPGRKMMPLVVNTSGWVKGAGYDLLVKMLRHISPTHVVQIRVSAESKNLPKGLFWLDENHQRSSNSIEICAAVKDSSSVSMRKDAAHVLRDVRIIAYFRQCLPQELAIATYKDLVRNLASAPAHEISLSRIRVIELHCEGNDNISHSLKAKIVGLGISTSVPPSPANASSNCVGLGFVRAEDVSKDLMYVITPVPLRILEKVDIILKGCIEAPACLLQVQEIDATDS